MFDNYKQFDSRAEAELSFCLAIGEDCFEINSIPGGPNAARLYFSRFNSVQWDCEGQFVLLSEMAGDPGRYYIRSSTRERISL